MPSPASIEDALRRSGIPYIIVGGVAFYKRKEIKDVLAYLSVLANPPGRREPPADRQRPVPRRSATTINREDPSHRRR